MSSLLLTSSPFLTWNAFCTMSFSTLSRQESLEFLGLPTTKLMSESLILSLHFHPFFVCIGFVLLNGETGKVFVFQL